MGLILCDNKIAKYPYHIEELGVNLYSMEELCFVIYEHPMLVMENFVNERLLAFLEGSLEKVELARHLRKMDKYSNEELLTYILENSGFYKKSEINKYKQRLAGYNSMSPSEYLKNKADYMFELGKYGKAVSSYIRILKLPKGRTSGSRFLGNVYNNLGSAYANIFDMTKAYESYGLAYNYLRDAGILKRMYFAAKLAGGWEEDEYMDLIKPATKVAWDQEYEETIQKVAEDARLSGIEEIFQMDSIKKDRYIRELIALWKQEYRNMM